MKITARKSLNKAYLKAPVSEELFDRFIARFQDFASKVTSTASEEFNKNLLADFLKNTYYAPNFFVNVNDRTDLAIHVGETPQSPVGVLIETKRSENAGEMVTVDSLNAKALQELLLYYLRERLDKGNSSIRHLLITDFKGWFIFDALEFDRLFFRNKVLSHQYRDFSENRMTGATTDYFYKSVAGPAIKAVEKDISFTYFTTADINALATKGKAGANQLSPFIKVFSPEHLLKLPFQNDNNSLNRNFFDELLHIIGLQEVTEKGKKVISRKSAARRDAASLVENTISRLRSLDRVIGVKGLASYGSKEEEQLFNIALELSLTWLNRVLFLKLLEAQLSRYHEGDRAYAFLRSEKISTYGDLNLLFFQVLAEPVKSREQHVRDRFPNVPYLNSSLFEVTDLERQTLAVSNLLDNLPLSAPTRTIFKSSNGKRFTGEKPALQYLLEFLDSYDFSSDGSDAIQDGQKLINASVLGLIFEKINGYRDGSFFTPGFITMQMARDSISREVVRRFSDAYDKPFTNLAEVYNAIPSGTKGLREANDIFNGITICDPAVGSGHFLVSALNELLAIKSDLGILADADGKRLKNYVLTVDSDELVITDDEAHVFAYRPSNSESQRVQETIFKEKRLLIEQCLFGVDLNKNSVNICRLRLWIELLKHSYYREDGTLETLPNLDINIKSGNSLLSRFALDSDLKPFLKKHKTSISDYQQAVRSYKNAQDKGEKRTLSSLIEALKGSISREILYNDPLILKVERLKQRVKKLELPQTLFAETLEERDTRDTNRSKYQIQLRKHESVLKEIEENRMFENAFEWRIEFPEVLNEDGTFDGFDVILGNPPYISAIGLQKVIGAREYKFLKDSFTTAKGAVDLYVYFFELAGRLAKAGASICYITPNRYLAADYGAALRRLLIEQFTFIKIIDYSRVNVFENAATYPIITHLAKGRAPEYTLSVVTQEINGESSARDFPSAQLGFTANLNLGFLLSDKYEIAKRVTMTSVPLTRAGRINATSTAAEADHFGRRITESGTGFKLVNTGTIDRYEHGWGTRSLTDKGRQFTNPRLPRDALLLKNRLSLYAASKIIFAKIALRNEAVLDAAGEFASVNTNCMHTFSKDFDPLFVLAWVNSKLFQYTYECFFDPLRMGGRFLPFTAPYLSIMCIKEADPKVQARIAGLASTLIAKLAEGNSTDTVEQEIDSEFYSLYALTTSEIQQVNDCFKIDPVVEVAEVAPAADVEN